MNMSLEGLRSGAGKFLGPANSLGELVLDTAEKMADLQIESGKAYSSIAFSQWKKVPRVRNFEEAGDFLWGQIEPISEVNKQLLHDWKSLVALNTEFTDGIKAAFSTAEKPKPAAAPAPKTASRSSKSGSSSTSASKPRSATARTTAKKDAEPKDSGPKDTEQK